jgi:hypothetical protein
MRVDHYPLSQAQREGRGAGSEADEWFSGA